MDRLTAEDLLMLWPDEIWPQEIGALAVLDATSLLDPGGRVRIEALRDVIAARQHVICSPTACGGTSTASAARSRHSPSP